MHPGRALTEMDPGDAGDPEAPEERREGCHPMWNILPPIGEGESPRVTLEHAIRTLVAISHETSRAHGQWRSPVLLPEPAISWVQTLCKAAVAWWSCEADEIRRQKMTEALADIILRMFDAAGGLDLPDLAETILTRMEYDRNQIPEFTEFPEITELPEFPGNTEQ